MHTRKLFIGLSLALSASVPSLAQSAVSSAPVATTAATVVPTLIRYSGIDPLVNGKDLASVTFLIYKNEQGGEPLWSETQSVSFDPAGHYAVYLGATGSSGLPLDLFGNGEARWLEVQIAGEKQQPRVLLTSVPYAMKALDAATLGGLPASAYMLASKEAPTAQTTPGALPDTSTPVTTTGGTAGYLPVFSGTATIDDSILYESGTTIGIGTKTPASTLDVNGAITARGALMMESTGAATSTAGKNSQPVDFLASAYNSSTKKVDGAYFQLQSEAADNNTSAPSATLNLLFSNNGAAPAETGLSISHTGLINFAKGQTFDLTSASAVAVEGNSTSGTGVEGTSSSGFGTTGSSTSGTGVYGKSSTSYGVLGTSSTASGVYGLTAGTTLNTAGVYGVAGSGNTSGLDGIAGVWGDATAHVGVLGTSDEYSGVQGSSLTNNGVFGSSGSGPGVSGSSTSGHGGQFSSGGYLAAVSASNNGSGQGLYVQSEGENVQALYADAEGSGSTGIYGISSGGPNSNGPSTGVEGVGLTQGVYGISPSGTGVYGLMSGQSVTGTYESDNNIGAAVWADTSEDGNSQGETALAAYLGTADDLSVGFFENNSNDFSTLLLENNGSGGNGLDVSGVLQANGAHGMCGIGDNGDLSCTGQMKSLSTTSSARTVETYAMQSPENWMEDFGSGSLSHGVTTVSIDPAFAETANTAADYHVFLTPRGDSKGLYVANVTATGFEVRESGGGTSSLSFDYRIVAKRRGYEAQRLTDVTERFRAETARASHFQQIARDAKASGKSKPGPLRLPGVPPSAVRAVHRAAR